jgi:hypothetical protein
MPARDWTDFLGVYYRPHLIVMDLGSPTDSAPGRKQVKLVWRLLESLGSTADFAILLEEHEIKVAFESDSDAEAIAGLVVARVVERGGDEWASKSICNFASSSLRHKTR